METGCPAGAAAAEAAAEQGAGIWAQAVAAGTAATSPPPAARVGPDRGVASVVRRSCRMKRKRNCKSVAACQLRTSSL